MLPTLLSDPPRSPSSGGVHHGFIVTIQGLQKAVSGFDVDAELLRWSLSVASTAASRRRLYARPSA